MCFFQVPRPERSTHQKMLAIHAGLYLPGIPDVAKTNFMMFRMNSVTCDEIKRSLLQITHLDFGKVKKLH